MHFGDLGSHLQAGKEMVVTAACYNLQGLLEEGLEV